MSAGRGTSKLQRGGGLTYVGRRRQKTQPPNDGDRVVRRHHTSIERVMQAMRQRGTLPKRVGRNVIDEHIFRTDIDGDPAHNPDLVLPSNHRSLLESIRDIFDKIKVVPIEVRGMRRGE